MNFDKSKSAIAAVLFVTCFILLGIAHGQSLSTSTDQIFGTSTDQLVPTGLISDPLPQESTSTASTSSVSVDLTSASTTMSDLAKSQAANPIQSGHSYALDNILQTIADREETYFKKHGKYLQILESQRLPNYEDQSQKIADLIGMDVPNGLSVNIYTGPNGSGFQVVYRDEAGVRALGSGPDAAELTYTNLVTSSTALTATSTTTPDVASAASLSTDTVPSDTSTSTPSNTDLLNGSSTPTFALPSEASTTASSSTPDLAPAVPTSTNQ